MVSNTTKVIGILGLGAGAYFLLRPKREKKTVGGGGGGSYLSDGIILNQQPATKKETITTTATDPTFQISNPNYKTTDKILSSETKKTKSSASSTGAYYDSTTKSLSSGLSPSAQKTATSVGLNLQSTPAGVQVEGSSTKKSTKSTFTGVFSSNRQTSSPRSFFRRLIRR
jgi:hypothetical protein